MRPAFHSLIALTAVAGSGQTAAPESRSVLAERVTALTRNAVWKPVVAIPVRFRTFHPQGMVRIGETFFVSSVEVRDREAGNGVGHLFKIDRGGNLVEVDVHRGVNRRGIGDRRGTLSLHLRASGRQGT